MMYVMMDEFPSRQCVRNENILELGHAPLDLSARVLRDVACVECVERERATGPEPDSQPHES